MIYFDYAATSIKRWDLVQEAMKNQEAFDGNPESTHSYGRKASQMLEASRRDLARSINAKPDQVIFTSGASEANNTIINNFRDQEILAGRIEHDSILKPLKGKKVIRLDAGENGEISLESIKKAISSETKLVCLMAVNNETGALQPIKEVGEYLKDRDIRFHVDGVQAYGHIDLDVEEIGCDSLSLSGHKIGGLNGFGLLYARNNLESFIKGGDQEKKRRAGTSFTLGAYTMAEAYKKTQAERAHIGEIKGYFLKSLKEAGIRFEVNGNLENSSDHILNLYLPQVKNDFLLTYLDMHGICASAGSACSAGSLEPSHVIENMYDGDRANHSLRFSFGFGNTLEEVDQTIEILKSVEGM